MQRELINVAHVIGGTQAMARFCCCTGASNGVFSETCISAESLVRQAQLFQHAALLVMPLFFRQMLCQQKH